MYSILNSQLFGTIPKRPMVITAFFLLCLLTQNLPAFAQETERDNNSQNIFATLGASTIANNIRENLRIQGFAGQSFIATSNNDVFGNTDEGGSFGFTEIGLNAIYRPLPKLQLSGQMLSRRAGEGNSGIPRLDFAFLDYRLYSQETNQFGIRFGRLKNPWGFYNDTRDVPFTRPSILLPQSIYFDRTRNVGLSSDSVQFYGETSHATWGDFSFQFGIARPIVDDRDTEVSLIPRAQGNLSPDITILGRGLYESPNKRFRFAVSGIWFNADYKPGTADTLGPGAIQFSPIYVSAQYNTERWSLTSEYAIRKFRYKNFGDQMFDSQDFYGESFYFQGEYRFSHKWEALMRYDVLFTNRNDRDGSKYAALTGLPAYTRFAKDLTLGLRWNINTQIMARFEYHRINGTGWLSPLDNPNPFNLSKNWDLFAVQLSFRF